MKAMGLLCKQPLDRRKLLRPGPEQNRKTTFNFDADHPEVFASEGQGRDAVEISLIAPPRSGAV